MNKAEVSRKRVPDALTPRDPIRFAFVGALLALGAPAGWFLLRCAAKGWRLRPLFPWAINEILSSPALYIYLTASTMFVFSLFGYRMGTVINRLRQQTQEKLQLRKLSITDALTGLLNRGFFNQRIEEEMARARRYGYRLSLILLDLDNLKSINDRYGHALGDEVLSRIGVAIDHALRETDLAFRYGGDEFVILLPNCPEEDVAEVENRIRTAIRELGQPNAPLGRPVTASSGHTTFHPETPLTGSELVSRADEEMYLRKQVRPGTPSPRRRHWATSGQGVG